MILFPSTWRCGAHLAQGPPGKHTVCVNLWSAECLRLGHAPNTWPPGNDTTWPTWREAHLAPTWRTPHLAFQPHLATWPTWRRAHLAQNLPTWRKPHLAPSTWREGHLAHLATWRSRLIFLKAFHCGGICPQGLFSCQKMHFCNLKAFRCGGSCPRRLFSR